MRYDEPLVAIVAISLALVAAAIAIGPWNGPYRLRTIDAVSNRYGKPVARALLDCCCNHDVRNWIGHHQWCSANLCCPISGCIGGTLNPSWKYRARGCARGLKAAAATSKGEIKRLDLGAYRYQRAK